MFQTAVAAGCSRVVDSVRPAALDVGLGIADREVEGEILVRLVLRLQVQVVAGIARAEHYGVVRQMGVAGGPVELVASAAQGEVRAVRTSLVAEDLSDPVVSLH